MAKTFRVTHAGRIYGTVAFVETPTGCGYRFYPCFQGKPSRRMWTSPGQAVMGRVPFGATIEPVGGAA